MRLCAILTLALWLAGMLGACVADPGTQTGRAKARAPKPVSQAAITIALPRTTHALSGDIRHSLTERGWSLRAYDAKTMQARGEYDLLARRARYRLTFSARRIGDCANGQAAYQYNLALIRNRNGRVELAETGTGCAQAIVDRFERGLDREQLVAPGSAGQGGG